MGRDAGTARATVRFAFGRGNTIEDVRMAADAVEDAIREMTGSQRSAD
jgi:cysteine sulfinate desulfinase/cysteine desulfurase-like protein